MWSKASLTSSCVRRTWAPPSVKYNRDRRDWQTDKSIYVEINYCQNSSEQPVTTTRCIRNRFSAPLLHRGSILLRLLLSWINNYLCKSEVRSIRQFLSNHVMKAVIHPVFRKSAFCYRVCTGDSCSSTASLSCSLSATVQRSISDYTSTSICQQGLNTWSALNPW